MSAQLILTYNTFLAILSFVALAVAAILVGVRLLRGSDHPIFSGWPLWMAWVVALVATIGSLVYSEVIHFVPCRLCWFQRIAMYPLSVVLLVGALRREAAARFYALPLAAVGLAISTWHYLIQLNPSWEGGACDPLNPCSARYVETFGFISIPFMAGVGFIVILILMLLDTTDRRDGQDSA
jgi:disulfide bond formation protein DsbB